MPKVSRSIQTKLGALFLFVNLMSIIAVSQCEGGIGKFVSIILSAGNVYLIWVINEKLSEFLNQIDNQTEEISALKKIIESHKLL